MPRTDDISKPIKEFKQKSYRPWDTLEELRPSFRVEQKIITVEKENELHRINRGQTEDKLETKQGQTEDKLETKQGQTEDTENLNRGQTEDKLETKLRTKPRTNWGQFSDNQPVSCLFASLIGVQRKITMVIYEECKLARDKKTAPLSMEHLANCCETSKFSAKKTVQRLEKKGILLRSEFKNGRGGWTRYEIPQLVFQEIIHSETNDKLRTKWGQSGNKLEPQLRTQPRTTTSCSSGLKDLNKITTTQEADESFSLPPEWEDIDFSELQRRGVNFGKSQIISLWSFLKNHSAEDFQESVDGFVYDIDNNHVSAKRGYLNFFIGIIRKGNLYISAHYISPERKKMNEIIQLAQKRKAEALLYQQALEDEAFHQWLEKQDHKKIRDQLPVSYWSAFECKEQEAYDWLKENIYRPQKIASTGETENN